MEQIKTRAFACIPCDCFLRASNCSEIFEKKNGNDNLNNNAWYLFDNSYLVAKLFNYIIKFMK